MFNILRQSSARRLIILSILALFIFLAAVIRQQMNELTSVITPVEAGSDQVIISWQTRLEKNPNDAAAYAQLGLAYLQQGRETADPQLHTLAEQAFNEALTRDAQQADALMGQGMLALARHDFQVGLQWGQRARKANPFRAQILGILVDAHTELGQYEEAVAMAQEMIDLRPDLASYSRVSYLRELHGDVNGAIGAMETAVATTLPGSESWAWTQVQLGHLFLNKGDVDKAEAIYEEALYYRPDYPYALGGLARVQAARGNDEAAIEILRPLVERFPLPEFAILLGDLYTINQQTEAARQQYDLVRLMQQLNEQAGVSVDLELGLFEADHGQPATAVQKARAAYHSRPSIFAADVVSWALYQDGQYEEAWVYAQEALRLGTQDALLHYHAGKIAQALGDARQAQIYLEKALIINPTFSILYAPDAQAILANYSSR
jgi:tetratricopeptide (TPR) repeat protein